jgi:hypothetical protein
MDVRIQLLSARRFCISVWPVPDFRQRENSGAAARAGIRSDLILFLSGPGPIPMKISVLIGRTALACMAILILMTTMIFGWWRFGDWQSRAVQDIEFIHETILSHHPGPVDPDNPEFMALMDEALARAMPLARSARSASDHHAAIDAYIDTFADGHLRAGFPGDALGVFSRKRSDHARMSDATGVNITGSEAWITISSFNERSSPIASITEAVEAQADTLRSLKTIVFDLRGNGGGDSSFARRISMALWTEEVFRDWVPVSAAGVDWRATADNAAHVHGISQRHEERGRTRNAEYWARIAERLDAAVSAGDDYLRQNFTTREVTRTIESPVSADVIVITDQACASSCLDFMDQLMALPGVLHVGAETSSDTQYIEVRHVDLPSRTGRLFFPLKVYRGRLRPPEGTYVPDVLIDADSLDPTSLRAMVDAARWNGG